ncbi:MAG: hypothetical protein AAF160_12220 [Pseudomonadota bacterium]
MSRAIGYLVSSGAFAARVLPATFLVIWLAGLVPLGLLYTTIPGSPDQAIFDYIGWLGTQGFSYYSDAFDHAWPGGFLAHEIAIRLFGVESWSFRTLDYAIMQLSTLAGAAFLLRSGHAVAATAFLALYPPIYVTGGYWMVGQNDMLGANFLLGAMALSIGRRPAGGRRIALEGLLAGLLLAGAVFLRPTYLAFAAGLGGLIALQAVLKLRGARMQEGGRVDLRRLTWMTAGLFGGFAAAALWALAAGNLSAWAEQAVLFNLGAYNDGSFTLNPVHTMKRVLWFVWHWITVLGLVGAAVWLWSCGETMRHGEDGARSRLALLATLGLGLTALVSFAVQRKGFDYHLMALLPALVLLIAMMADWGARAALGIGGPTGMLWQMTRRLAGTLLLFGWLAVVSVGTLAKLPSLSPAAAAVSGAVMDEGRWRAPLLAPNAPSTALLDAAEDIMRAPKAPEGTFLQFGRAYELAFLSERLPPTRFIAVEAAMVVDPESVLGQRWNAEFAAALEAEMPAFVFIAARHLPLDPLAHPMKASLAELLAYERYLEVLRGREGVLYQRSE